MKLIEVKNVSKAFRRNTGRQLIRQYIRALLRPKSNRFYALRNVSLEVSEGESVAIIGANGAGKSTLLSLVAGLARPDTGTLKVNGRIAALLELGSGFHPDLTGTENVMLNAALLGFDQKHVRSRMRDIVEFSEIGDFINEPLRTYSSGMVVRLAFSIAVHVDPAILIVDEVLGVGDSHFYMKCLARIAELRRQGRTMLSVSHNPHMVLEFCDRAIWLSHGEVAQDGPSPAVMNAYLTYAANSAVALV
jgi:homopolymeric O-antigen transport system ATP-binding protein